MYGWYIGPSHAKLLRSKVDRRRVYGYFTGLSRNTGVPTVHFDLHEDDVKHFKNVFKPFTYTEAVLILGQDKADSLVELGKVPVPETSELENLQAMQASLDEVHEAVNNPDPEKLPSEDDTGDKPQLDETTTESAEIEKNEAPEVDLETDSESDSNPEVDETLTDKKPAAEKTTEDDKPKTPRKRRAKKSADTND